MQSGIEHIGITVPNETTQGHSRGFPNFLVWTSVVGNSRHTTVTTSHTDRSSWVAYMVDWNGLERNLGGHPKPAIEGHFKTGQR
jgi:hypothetical protein